MHCVAAPNTLASPYCISSVEISSVERSLVGSPWQKEMKSKRVSLMASFEAGHMEADSAIEITVETLH